MRAWNVVGKYPVYDDEGKVSHTDITIASTTGSYATYTERTIGDQRDKSEQELVELAREAHFKSEYAERAMAESVQKIDELEKSIKENKKLNEELRQAILEAKAGLIENKNTVDTAVAELTGLMMGMMGISEPVEGAEDEESIE